jgi:hypothetical protein
MVAAVNRDGRGWRGLFLVLLLVTMAGEVSAATGEVTITGPVPGPNGIHEATQDFVIQGTYIMTEDGSPAQKALVEVKRVPSGELPWNVGVPATCLEPSRGEAKRSALKNLPRSGLLEHTLDPDNDILPVGCYGPKKGLRCGLAVLMDDGFPLLVQDADVHGSGI